MPTKKTQIFSLQNSFSLFLNFLLLSTIFSLLLLNFSLTVNASFSVDLPATTISYLGSNSADRITAIAIQSNGTVLISGSFTSLPTASQEFYLNGANSSAKGSILRLSSNGQEVLSVTKLGQNVDQIAIDPNTDEIIAYNQDGLFKLSTDASSVVWSKTGGDYGRANHTPSYSSGRRLSVAKNGDVVVLGNISEASNRHRGFAYIVSADGDEIGRVDMPRSDIGGGTYNEKWEDIAIDSDSRQIFVTGYAQRCTDYQSPFVMAYNYEEGGDFGTRNWSSYTLWCSAAVNLNLGSDSRGKRVDFKNGDLLFVGNSDGGNNRFTRQGSDHTISEPNLIQIDAFNNGAGFGVGKIGFFARLNPIDGNARKAQFQYTKQSLTGVNDARSFEIDAISMDENGDVLIAGQAFRNIPRRNELTINEQSIGNRIDNETAILVVNNDFNQRILVSSLTGLSNVGVGSVTNLATNNGIYVATGFTQGQIMEKDSLQPFGAGGRPFFAIWGEAEESADPIDPDPSNKIESKELILTEINWAGSSASSQDQWIELYNNTEGNLELDDVKLSIDEQDFVLADFCTNLELANRQYYLVSKYQKNSENTLLNAESDCVINTLALSPDGNQIKLYSNTVLIDAVGF